MSCVPWLIQLNAVMSRMRYPTRRSTAGLNSTSRNDDCVIRIFSRVSRQTSVSRTRVRMSRLINAGMIDSANSHRHDRPSPDSTTSDASEASR